MTKPLRDIVPLTESKTPGGYGSQGFKGEKLFNKHLVRHGLTRPNASNRSIGHKTNDFYVLRPDTHEHVISGEHKMSLRSLGSIQNINYHPDKKWHIKNEAKKSKPSWTSSLKPLLKGLNKVHPMGPPKGGLGPGKFVKTKPTDLTPLHNYWTDKNIDIVHIHGMGSYRVGKSRKKDRFGTGLPPLEGEMHFRAYRRTKKTPYTTARAVVNPKSIKEKSGKSHTDMSTPSGIRKFTKNIEKFFGKKY